jgi:hypothetical protein
MYEALLPVISDLFCCCGSSFRVMREPTIGEVIPDILLGTWPGQMPFQGPFGNIARHVLAFLQSVSNRPLPARLIADELFLTEGTLEGVVRQLRRAGAIYVAGSGEIQVTPQFFLYDLHVVAIEVKLKRWKQALAQAQRYLAFADEAYVVLDANQTALSQELREEFELSAVGLLMQRGSTVEKVFSATAGMRTPSADRVLAAQKLALSGPYCSA